MYIDGFISDAHVIQSIPFDSGSAGCQVLNGLGCNRTHPFDSGSAGCQVLYGNRTYSLDSGSAGCQVLHGN